MERLLLLVFVLVTIASMFDIQPSSCYFSYHLSTSHTHCTQSDIYSPSTPPLCHPFIHPLEHLICLIRAHSVSNWILLPTLHQSLFILQHLTISSTPISVYRITSDFLLFYTIFSCADLNEMSPNRCQVWLVCLYVLFLSSSSQVSGGEVMGSAATLEQQLVESKGV